VLHVCPCAAALQVARGCSIFLFYPLLSSGRVGYPMTWRTALFMVWAGLRGAVSGLWNNRPLNSHACVARCRC
jgi:NhaP-type Na+/H+ or K+/H+ antiporter